MATKYWQHQDAVQKWGLNVAIKRGMLQTLAEDATDVEFTEESTRLPEKDDRTSKD